MKNGKLTTMDLLKSNAIGILALMMILSGVTGATGTYHFTGDSLDKETFQKIYEYLREHGNTKETCLKSRKSVPDGSSATERCERIRWNGAEMDGVCKRREYDPYDNVDTRHYLGAIPDEKLQYKCE